MKWKIKATRPPQVKKLYAPTIAWILAIVFLLFAVLHLVRIDKLVPGIAETLPGAAALWFVAVITICEVLALPFLLRMRLSPLFRIKSGILVAIVPLAWTCLTIWAFGTDRSSGQFSSYVSTPASWWLLGFNALWLAVSYWTLWLLNFDDAFRQLRARTK